MNRQERRAAQKRGVPTASPMAPTLTSAFRAHQAGHRAEAEKLYRDVLAVEPRNASALHLSGVLAHQGGRSDEAISLIGQAIAVDPRNVDFHYNLASVLQSAGRLPDAAAHYEKAIALKSNHAEAHFDLGNVLARMERWPEAAASLKRALALKPNDAATLNNLGMVLREQGQLDEAMSVWQRAVAAEPSFHLAHMNIGLACKTQKKNAEAVASLNKALELKPDSPDILYNLALVQLDQSQHAEAMKTILRGLDASPTPELQALFVTCLQTMPQIPAEDRIRNLIARAMTQSWSRPEQLSAATVILKANPVISNGIAHINKHWPRPVPVQEMLGAGGLATIAQDQLLTAALESAPIADFDLERFLSGLRFVLLAAARQGDETPVAEPVLRLSCALARQCFINDYVFAQSEDEASRVRDLQAALATALRGARPVPPQWIAAVAAYAPLNSMSGAELLLKQQWPEPIEKLLDQQLREPAEEQKLQSSISTLIDVADEDAQSKYAAPRWTGLPQNRRPIGIDAYLRRGFPHAQFESLGKSGPLDILVAGCGTGQSAIEIAQRHPSPNVLAVDASRANLAYAQRQTQRLGVANVSYAQADSTGLPAPGKTFDVIDATGAMRDAPGVETSLRSLTSMLRPRGFMLATVEGARIRQAIEAARDFARSGNYQPDDEGIRLVRQNIMRLPDGAPARLLGQYGEFYTAAACRDLLFRRQDDPLTLGNIGAMLGGAGLTLLGIDADLRILDRYGKRFPQDLRMTDLANWQRFDAEDADMTASSFNIWLQKT